MDTYDFIEHSSTHWFYNENFMNEIRYIFYRPYGDHKSRLKINIGRKIAAKLNINNGDKLIVKYDKNNNRIISLTKSIGTGYTIINRPYKSALVVVITWKAFIPDEEDYKSPAKSVEYIINDQKLIIFFRQNN